MNNERSQVDGTWIFVGLALITYVLPWILNRSFTISLGAYDFAELLAQKRPFDDLVYNTVMALRGQLVFFTLLIAFSTKRPYLTLNWWVRMIFCLILIIAQLPPLTFINNLTDVNQQQQAILTGISLIGTIIGLTGVLWHYRHFIRILIAIGGISVAVYGIINAIRIIEPYGVRATMGFGVVGLIIIYALMGIMSLWRIARD